MNESSTSPGSLKAVRLSLAAIPALLALCSCGPRISDERVERFVFPGGEVLINQSHVETDWRSPVIRPSRLTLEPAAGGVTEKVGELRPSASSNCCLLESVKPVRLERSGDLAALVFGNYLFTKWDWEAPARRRWDLWDAQQDSETNYFLRHFPCKTAPSTGQDGPAPCFFSDGSPYRETTLDLAVPQARFSRAAPQAGWPRELVYTAPTRSGWTFDFERTVRANPGLPFKAFAADLQVEARFLQTEDEFSSAGQTPEDFTRLHRSARVILQQTLPIEATAWTTVSATAGAARYSYEFRAGYGDPDPDWCTIYTRFSGWKGQNARFLRIGQWLTFGNAGYSRLPGSGRTDTTVAGFIRLVRR